MRAAASFFMFDLSWLVSHDAIVTSAEVNARLWYSPSCTNPDPSRKVSVSLWSSNSINSSTTWNTKPKLGSPMGARSVLAGYSTSCPATNLGWNVGGWVKDLVDGNGPTATVGLIADDETYAYGWKRFDHATMIVHYDRLPTAPTSLATVNATKTYPCTRAPNEAFVATTTPTLRAKVYDPDGEALADLVGITDVVDCFSHGGTSCVSAAVAVGSVVAGGLVLKLAKPLVKAAIPAIARGGAKVGPRGLKLAVAGSISGGTTLGVCVRLGGPLAYGCSTVLSALGGGATGYISSDGSWSSARSGIVGGALAGPGITFVAWLWQKILP